MQHSFHFFKLFIVSACFLSMQPLFAQQIQLEEKKSAAAEQAVLLDIIPEPTTVQREQQRPVSQAQNIMNYLRLHGTAAAQRVRGLLWGPPMHRRAHNAGCALLSAGGCAGLYGQLEGTLAVPGPIAVAGTVGSVSFFASMILPYFKRYFVHSDFFNAIRNGDIDKVRYLLATGFINANANNFGIRHTIGASQRKVPLIVAAQHGQAAIAKLLLDKGADISLKDNAGKTVEEYLQAQPNDTDALKQGKLGVVRVILEHKLQKSAQLQRQLRSVHGPVEAVAAAAIEALHRRLYGNVDLGLPEDISSIVISYLSPTYVRPEVKTQVIRVAQRKTEAVEKKEEKELV